MYDEKTDTNQMKLEDVPWKYTVSGGGWKDKQLAELGAKISNLQIQLKNGGTHVKKERPLEPEEIEKRREKDTQRVLTPEELETNTLKVKTNFTDATRKMKEAELQILLQRQVERKQETLSVQHCRRPFRSLFKFFRFKFSFQDLRPPPPHALCPIG